MNIRRDGARSRGMVLAPGFTLVELLFVVLIASVLATIAMPKTASYLNQREVNSARNAFIMMAAQARASSIERGEIVVLRVNPANGQVRVTNADGTEILAPTLDLGAGPMRATITPDITITVCYTPRGFAHPGCTTPALPVDVSFGRGSYKATAEVSFVQVQRK